jgi:primosomal protein N' (replication factor Y)
VALLPAPSGLPDTLTYGVPAELAEKVRPGVCVQVPLGPRELLGYVIRSSVGPGGNLRPLLAVVDAEPAFTEASCALMEWMAAEYCCALSDVLPLCVPMPHEPRLQTTLAMAPEWDGQLKGRAGPLTTRAARMIRQALAAAGGSLTREALLRQLPQPNVPEVLRRCREEGWIREERALEAPRARPLTFKALALVAEKAEAGKRLGRRAQQVVEYLRARAGEQEPVLQRDLLAELGIGSDVVRRLEAAGIVRARPVPVRREPGVMADRSPAPELSPAQAAAAEAIQGALEAGTGEALLLFGVTGSGKTEVYLRAIEAARARGRTAILLVPEISLTAQVAAAVRARLGDRIAILHSALSEGERFDEWERLRRGEADVAVGPRSALFAPLPEPGLIVVDEEHDSSYKQGEPAPRYHAREVARQRAARGGGCVVLGSATPALESFYRSETGRDRLLELRERILGRPLPEVEVVDLREHRGQAPAIFGDRLAEALRERVSAGEQAILFVNRRGFSAFVLCRDCGLVPRCPRCDVSLTLHRAHAGRLICHYCGFERRAPERCARCGGARVRPFGVGTQRVEAAAQELLPGARVARLDRDTTRRRGAHAEIVAGFRERQFDVLVGTQMVTKGFDFPGVTLVGVVTADVALHTPDFRAGERAFQLLTQVSGRAGRGEQAGEVIVQTFNPGHPSIGAAAEHDYLRFYRAELPARRELGYPPFGRLARLLVSQADEGAAEGKIQAAAELLAAAASGQGVEQLGPTAAPLSRLNNRYRWHLVLRAAREGALHALLGEVRPQLQRRVGGVAIDVDPVDLL